MICNLIQWLVSRAEDDGTAMPGWAKRHVDICPECRQFHAAAAALSVRLKGDAANWKPGFDVSCATAPRADDVPVSLPRMVWAASALAIFMLMVGFVMVRNARLPVEGKGPFVMQVSPAALLPLPRSFEQLGGELLARVPWMRMEYEVDRLALDTERAAGGLLASVGME